MTKSSTHHYPPPFYRVEICLGSAQDVLLFDRRRLARVRVLNLSENVSERQSRVIGMAYLVARRVRRSINVAVGHIARLLQHALDRTRALGRVGVRA